MCQRVTCRDCGKPTYRGCGMHVEQVLAGVPKSQRCQGDCVPSGNASPGGFLSLFRRRRGAS
jgi:hypothetical protein